MTRVQPRHGGDGIPRRVCEEAASAGGNGPGRGVIVDDDDDDDDDADGDVLAVVVAGRSVGNGAGSLGRACRAGRGMRGCSFPSASFLPHHSLSASFLPLLSPSSVSAAAAFFFLLNHPWKVGRWGRTSSSPSPTPIAVHHLAEYQYSPNHTHTHSLSLCPPGKSNATVFSSVTVGCNHYPTQFPFKFPFKSPFNIYLHCSVSSMGLLSILPESLRTFETWVARLAVSGQCCAFTTKTHPKS